MHKDSALTIKNKFLSGENSASEITSCFLLRAKIIDNQTGALLSILSDRAMKKAENLDRKRKNGKSLGKLAGIPIVVKDNILIKDEITTCGSKFLENYRAPFNATVINLIDEEDGIIIAKSNLDEFAMGSSTENSAYKIARNPWNLDYSPGGSSGGSAISVSAMIAPIALGSDTGGSIRLPAAFCGVHGFKPTYGRVSRFGLVAFGSSLDQIGPFARSAEEIALMQEVIAKPCKYDSNSVQYPVEPYMDELSQSIQGKTIGVPYSILKDLEPEILKNFENSLKVYESLGVKIKEIHLNLIKYSVPVYYILAAAEASTNLARFDGIRYTERSKNAHTLEEVYELSRSEFFGKEVKQRILLGTYVLSAGYQDAYYRKAQKVRTLMIEEYEEAFKLCDIIALPTTTTNVFKIGAIQDPLQMYKQDIYTISANLVGIPAINIPTKLDKNSMPLGIQIQGPQLDDARVLRFAWHYEKSENTNKFYPNLFDKEMR